MQKKTMLSELFSQIFVFCYKFFKNFWNKYLSVK